MTETRPATGFVDRNKRLAVLGGLAVLCGAASAALAVVSLLLPMLVRGLPGAEGLEADPRSLAVNAVLLVTGAVALVWLGIGSFGARRWVRPLMLILAWTWLLCGGVTFLLSWLTLDALVYASAPDAGPELQKLLRGVMLLVLAVGCLLLPAVFIWGYQGRDVQLTCETANPGPDWTERCPVTVLGLSVGLGAGAYLALPTAVYAMAPVFGQLWTGWPAVLLTLLGGGVCAWLARATYRCSSLGWWGSLALFVLIGVSTSLTFLRVELIELYRTLGYPDTQLEILADRGTIPPAWLAGGMLALTLASVVYLLRIRRYFTA